MSKKGPVTGAVSHSFVRPWGKFGRQRKRRPREQRVPSGPEQGYLTNQQRSQTVVSGVAARLWLGEKGRSELVAGRCALTESVAPADREQVAQELQERLLVEVAHGVWQKTGLLYPRGSEMLARIEWLVLLDAESDPDPGQVESRLQGFCQGWSQVLPPGVRAHQMTGPQVQALGRRLLGTVPSRTPDPQE